MRIDPDKVAEIIKDVARTEIMPRFRNLAAGEVREKNPGDFVTVADEASEKALSAALMAAYPGTDVVGEEAVAHDKKVLEKLQSDRPIWILDPIDGTYNFAHGRSKFGVLVALVRNGVTEMGWAYDVPGDRMVIAIKGQGCTINGKKAAIRKSTESLEEMSGMGGGGQAWHFEEASKVVKEIVNIRCSLHDFLNFAAGEVDFVVHITKVTPWDHSATVLFVEEAGAYVAIVDDEKEGGIPFRPEMYRTCVLIAAADRERWNMLAQGIVPRLKKKQAS